MKESVKIGATAKNVPGSYPYTLHVVFSKIAG
jgi:hypothetical protein